MPGIIRPPNKPGEDVLDALDAMRNAPPANTELLTLLGKANNEYTPWEKFKRLPMPAGYKPEALWHVVKTTRGPHYRKLWFLTDLNGDRFRFWLPPSAQMLLHKIDRQSLRPNQVRPDDATSSQYIEQMLMEEAIASSILEGAATTVAAASSMLRQGRKPRTYAEKMVANNYRAMQEIKKLFGLPLTKEMLNELQAIITAGTLKDPDQAGRFQRPDEIRAVVEDVRWGEIVHRPPPAEELDDRFQRVCRFANEDSLSDGSAITGLFIHPVVRAILLHFAISYLHPYADGNGRVARAVFHWSMLKQGYHLIEYLAVSQIIREAPVKYAHAFIHSEIDEWDTTYFILYHLQVIDRALQQFHKFLEKKRHEIEQANRLLRRRPEVNARQRALLAHALKNPHHVYTVAQHASYHQVVKQTARTDLLALAEMGLLEKVKSGKRLEFLPAVDFQEKLTQ